jgi:hypothetical protein
MRFDILVTADMVKAEANRRIEAVYPLWKQANVLRQGGPAVETMGAFIDAVRAASDALEAQVIIPADFAADHYWTPSP